MSAASVSLTAFPLSHVSATASISKFSSIRSAILFKIFARSAGDVFPHAGAASCAASRASSTSSAVDLDISQNTSPVTGVTFSKYIPLTGGIHFPPMRLSYLSLKLTTEPSVFGASYFIRIPPYKLFKNSWTMPIKYILFIVERRSEERRVGKERRSGRGRKD